MEQEKRLLDELRIICKAFLWKITKEKLHYWKTNLFVILFPIVSILILLQINRILELKEEFIEKDEIFIPVTEVNN
jgi:hypothetical protein